MSVYARFKRNPEGLRQLVELLESTPSVRRKKMIDVGMAEDPDYTEKALKLCFSFEDILGLPDGELCEVMAKAPTRSIAYAISSFDQAVKDRFLRCTPPRRMGEVKEYLEEKVGPREIGGGQMKLIESARQCEKAGLIRTKRING